MLSQNISIQPRPCMYPFLDELKEVIADIKLDPTNRNNLEEAKSFLIKLENWSEFITEKIEKHQIKLLINQIKIQIYNIIIDKGQHNKPSQSIQPANMCISNYNSRKKNITNHEELNYEEELNWEGGEELNWEGGEELNWEGEEELNWEGEEELNCEEEFNHENNNIDNLVK